MLYKLLPGTSLDLSIIGFGCWAIGGKWWGPTDDRESKRAIAHALELGINWFDTAPIYGFGHADTVLSEALGSARREVVIATKVGPRWDDSEHAVCDLSPENIRRDVEESLGRLRLDTIPLVQIHWACERGTPLRESLDALEDLRRAGKLRYYGLCNYAVDEVVAARRHSSVATLQRAFSMVRRELERDLDSAAREGIGLLVYETLCRGLLTGKFAELPTFPESDMRARDDRFAEPGFSRISSLVEALRILARRLDCPPAALAVAWTLTHPAVSAAIVGAKTEAQVGENVRAVELVDRRKLWQALAPHVDRCRI